MLFPILLYYLFFFYFLSVLLFSPSVVLFFLSSFSLVFLSFSIFFGVRILRFLSRLHFLFVDSFWSASVRVLLLFFILVVGFFLLPVLPLCKRRIWKSIINFFFHLICSSSSWRRDLSSWTNSIIYFPLVLKGCTIFYYFCFNVTILLTFVDL